MSIWMACCCTGCISHQVGEALAPTVLEAALAPGFEVPLVLAHAANEFRAAKGRWPQDYPELSTFLRNSDPEARQKMDAVRFSRIEFSDAPDGKLKVTAEYSVPPNARLASGINVTYSSGTVTINDLTISPADSPALNRSALPR